MATNIGEDGTYPLDGEVTEINFDRIWRNQFSLFPEVASLDWKQREHWKRFAQKIVDGINFDDRVQKVADTAFNDGYDDGVKSAVDEMNDVLDKIEKETAPKTKQEILDDIRERLGFL